MSQEDIFDDKESIDSVKNQVYKILKEQIKDVYIIYFFSFNIL